MLLNNDAKSNSKNRDTSDNLTMALIKISPFYSNTPFQILRNEVKVHPSPKPKGMCGLHDDGCQGEAIISFAKGTVELLRFEISFYYIIDDKRKCARFKQLQRIKLISTEPPTVTSNTNYQHQNTRHSRQTQVAHLKYKSKTNPFSGQVNAILCKCNSNKYQVNILHK